MEHFIHFLSRLPLLPYLFYILVSLLVVPVSVKNFKKYFNYFRIVLPYSFNDCSLYSIPCNNIYDIFNYSIIFYNTFKIQLFKQLNLLYLFKPLSICLKLYNYVTLWRIVMFIYLIMIYVIPRVFVKHFTVFSRGCILCDI